MTQKKTIPKKAPKCVERVEHSSAKNIKKRARSPSNEEEEEELLPDRSEPSLSLLLDLLAERDRRAGFFFFLLIFGTEALDPPAFGGSSIMSSGSISFALPFKILVSRLFISLTCNVRASIDDWQEY